MRSTEKWPSSRSCDVLHVLGFMHFRETMSGVWGLMRQHVYEQLEYQGRKRCGWEIEDDRIDVIPILDIDLDYST